MKFIDQAIIKLAAGHGGKGSVSFRHEKHVPRGGPDGGNGGRGGDIILRVDPHLSTLMDFKYRTHFRAERGTHGGGSGKDGKNGADVVLKVPPGTLVYDNESGEELCDLMDEGEQFVAARGGRGGKGNAFFTTSVRQAPRFAQPGEEGEEKTIRLELKLIADVGLVGLPNAGKSTLLSVISKAHPKIADYPFTTLSPLLGVVVHRSYPPFTVADMPGLIEGAHKGEGLGIQFLKHVERTKLLLHLVSAGPEEETDPLTRLATIQKELKAYNPHLAKKEVAVVLTKIDLLPTAKELNDLKSRFKKKGYSVFAISAVTQKGVDELLDFVAKIVGKREKD